jgi:phosphate uptake regulator
MPASLINDPKHWRDRAKEASAIADEMKDPDAKQAMLGIARNYLLARESRSAGKGFATIKVPTTEFSEATALDK